MLLDKLRELKKAKGLTSKQIAEATKLPEKTVNRIFSGETENPYVDTLHRIVTVLDASLDDVLVDTKMVVATKTNTELKDNVDAITAQKDLIMVKNEMLEAKVSALTAENELLKKELAHKEELLALHNLYQTHIKKLTNKGES